MYFIPIPRATFLQFMTGVTFSCIISIAEHVVMTIRGSGCHIRK
ncbi:hypothetical protein OCJ35_16235 [Pluralibacter gergoviae]|nr:hypothetical protein [Pluralibacter gergoviae]MCV7759641.1 hypothetical protein [Pluralibacter gergoviae]